MDSGGPQPLEQQQQQLLLLLLQEQQQRQRQGPLPRTTPAFSLNVAAGGEALET